MELRDTSLMVQWLGLCTSTAGAMGLIPGQGTEIPLATQCGKIEKRKDLYVDEGGFLGTHTKNGKEPDPSRGRVKVIME